MKKEHIIQYSRWVRDQLDEFSAEFIEYGLNVQTGAGLCAIASVTLQRVLQQHNHSSWVIEAFDGEYSHCWVEDNRYAIDITSQQFNNKSNTLWPRILVLDKTLYYKLKFIKIVEKRAGKYAVRQIYNTWGFGQNPSTFHEIINAIVERSLLI